jgi:hypothetical protein
MQVCSCCQKMCSDVMEFCPNCRADLSQFSTLAITLKRYRENARVSLIRVSVPADACPVCQQTGGTYTKDHVPQLPVAGCSELHGCRNFYEPVLDLLYP